MTEAWRSVKIRQFEQVMAGPSVALLRIEGKASWRRPGSEERPTLVADDGETVHRFPALPSPPDARGTLRAAYSVPAATITPQTAFSLRLGDGQMISLPAPTAAASRVARPETPAPASEAAQDAPDPGAAEGGLAGDKEAAAQAQEAAGARDRIAELEARNAELEGLLADHETRLAEAERAAEASRAELEELEVWRGELERRLTSTTTELGDAQVRLSRDQEELDHLRALLADAATPSPDAAPDAAFDDGTGDITEPEVDLQDLGRRALAEASRTAARELAEAAAEAAQSEF